MRQAGLGWEVEYEGGWSGLLDGEALNGMAGSPVPGTRLAALNHIRLSLARLAVR